MSAYRKPRPWHLAGGAARAPKAPLLRRGRTRRALDGRLVAVVPRRLPALFRGTLAALCGALSAVVWMSGSRPGAAIAAVTIQAALAWMICSTVGIEGRDLGRRLRVRAQRREQVAIRDADEARLRRYKAAVQSLDYLTRSAAISTEALNATMVELSGFSEAVRADLERIRDRLIREWGPKTSGAVRATHPPSVDTDDPDFFDHRAAEDEMAAYIRREETR